MQNNNHHEDFQANAALYALGALPDFEARAFADELALASDAARAEAAEFDAIVTQLGLSVAEATPSTDVRARLMARLAHDAQAANTRAPSANSAVPFHQDVLSGEGKWRRLFDGVNAKTLFTDPATGYVTSLLKLNPGARIPNHKHHGNEQCLIVSGEFRINDKVYGPGDFTVALTGSKHLDLYTETGTTLLIVAPPEYEWV
jgi:anti-sigma factor ChrR (cupin superfamily)